MPTLDAEVKHTLDDVTKSPHTDVILHSGLELTLPLVPLLLSKETTLEAGAGLDLRQVSGDPIHRAKR